MVVLNNLFALAEQTTQPGGLWQWLILNVFENVILDYGWRVVVFTLLLKLLLSPLDIYQRVAMKKNQRITEQLKPEMEKLEKQYGKNPQVLQAKKQELNKKNGVKMASGCITMLVTLGISIYLLMGGLNPISQYKNMMQYVHLYDAYNRAETQALSTGDYNAYYLKYDADGNLIADGDEQTSVASVVLRPWEDFLPAGTLSPSEAEKQAAVSARNEVQAGAEAAAKISAEAAVEQAYYYGLEGINQGEKVQEGFLWWVKNIWVADVPWEKPVKNYKDFKTAVANFGTDPKKLGLTMDKDTFEQEVMGSYEKVMGALYESEQNTANGFLVLPILSILVMVGSQMLTRRTQKKSGQDPAAAAGPMAGTGKMMTYLMPVMFGIFSLFYTTAFSLYMITNSAVMIIVSLSSSLVMHLMDKREVKEKVSEEGLIRYGRPDPNAKKQDSTKTKK